MRKYNNTVINQFDSLSTGNSAAGATITVRDSETKVLVTLYSLDEAIPANEIDNPVIADGLGNYGFYVEDGVYDLVINENQTSTYTVYDEQIKEVNGTTSVKEVLTIVNDETTYTLDFSSGPESDLIVDGRVMTSGASIVGNILTLDEALYDTQEAWVYHNGLVTANTDSGQGSRGNPYIFDTTSVLIANNASLTVGDWTETLGNLTKYDGDNVTYLVVTSDSVGEQDGYQIVDLNGKKGFGLYFGGIHSTNNGGDTTVSNFPYNFDFPANDLDRQEMLNNLKNNSIGYGGSTWWTRPVAVGRKEDGLDVIYRGDTYGSPENRDLAQGSMDSTLWTNKRLGEAIIKTTRLTYDGTDYEYTFTALNDQNVSYREDEHHQPGVIFSNINGKLITGWGSRNSARSQDGADVSNTNYVRYGQDSNTLSVTEKIQYDNTADYLSMFAVGRTMYGFSRENVGDWHFVRGSSENFLDPVHFFDAQGTELTQQFYFGISGVDKSQVLTDPQTTTDRNLVHFFGSPHPTANPDNKLYYCKATFILAGQEAAPFDGGGLYLTKKDGVTPISGIDGKLDTDFIAFQKTAMDEAYDPGVGKSYRLLDVYYGDDAIALIAEFTFDWTHGDTVPYQTTYDLKTVRSTAGGAFVVSTLKPNLRGILAYDPTQNGTSGLGVEGYTSFYANGACFWRGKDYTDTQPIIYYCDRDGDKRDGYRLSRINCTDTTFTAVSTTDILIQDSQKVLYRPEMTLYGDKRILWYNSADGYSSFNSWVADTKFLDETI